MLENKRETLSKAFGVGVQAKHVHEYKCIKLVSYYMYHKTPEHTLKSYFGF